MNNTIQIFNNRQFGTIRTLNIENEPWFVGKDVAEILKYERATKAIVDRVDEEDRKMIDGKTQSRFGIELGQRGGWIINESGLYSLILSSKLPSAKEFKRWVTSEVLPTIRKTGMFTINNKVDSYMIEDPIARAERWIEEEKERKALKVQIEEQKPLVEYAEHIQASKDVIDMKSMAKLASKNGIKIGRNKLFSFLRNRKILDKENIPYANYMSREWFEVVESPYTCFSGEVKINRTTLVSPKGQMGIVNLLKKYYAT